VQVQRQRQSHCGGPEKQNWYQDKNCDATLYQLVLTIWQHFGTELMLGQVYHKFMSQKSESLHQQISRVAPKDKHFSSSMALLDRVALVVITDSVGYEVGVLMIFEELGVELPPVTVQYLVRRNKRREYGKKYNQCLDVKDRRYSDKKQKIRDDLEQKAADAGSKGSDMNYCPSIDMEDIIDATGETPEVHVDGHVATTMAVEGNNGLSGAPKKKPPQRTMQCKNCPNKGHGTWVSKHCANHDQYLAMKNE